MRKYIISSLFLVLVLAVFVAGCNDGSVETPDTTAPRVISTQPANDDQNVAINSLITATFSEAMNPSTITTATFTLRHGTTPVAGTVTYAGTTATFTPAVPLANDTTFTATIHKGPIPTGVHDLVCNTLANDYVWTFKTAPIPVVVTISPETATLFVSTTQQFTTNVTGTANSNVVWSVIGGGTVSQTGLYSAPATAGTYLVTATSEADPTVSDTATVTVQSGTTIITIK